MSHGVAAACKAACSGFDSHRRLDTINCRFGLHLPNVPCLNHFFVERVIDKPQLPVGTTSTRCYRVPQGTMFRRIFVEAFLGNRNQDPTAVWDYT